MTSTWHFDPTPGAANRLPGAVLEAVRSAQRAVVFGGAGMSAESGIATFRDAQSGALWSRFDAEQLATPEAFLRDPERVWGWYEWRRMQVLQARPNDAHRAVVELAQRLPQLRVITQNVDDLHERAGSREVLHLHGSLHQARCFDCAAAHPLDAMPDEPEAGRYLAPPRCLRCGGPVRPGVVWFGEGLDPHVLDAAFAAAGACDLFLSVGTSGLVHPAAQLPDVARQQGATLLHMNPQKPQGVSGEDVCLLGPAGQILPLLLHQAWG
ncbi:NAD-dependent deacylase [Pseudomonas sp. PS02288]|uniref:SIR2 family NAD-dependent protein deacylase n=1 Tax=Pseudomonas sp. PS02288 TaxID=2991443 RepID=UPI00249B95CE|nr:NAD-dependent deacylase [Pseudomonas sp. PS02288]